MFTELCIIKKSYNEDFLNKLKEIGYSIDDYAGDEKDCEYIINIPQCEAISFGWSKAFYLDMIYNGAIECENKEQFLAISAIRDDSDYMQYFVCTENYTEQIGSLCKDWKIGDMDLYDIEDYYDTPIPHWRKATVLELIEHFKTK